LNFFHYEAIITPGPAANLEFLSSTVPGMWEKPEHLF